MTPDQIPLAILDLRHTGATLAHPCHCGHPHCTLGDHIWRSTRDMAPGIRAQAFEPRTITATGPPTDNDPPADPTTNLHHEYARRIAAAQHAARDLKHFIDRHRPDRWTPDTDGTAPLSDEAWCTNHLENFGSCETRHRGDLCRWCDDIRLAHGFTPDRPLMRARHEGRRVTERMVLDAKKRVLGTTTRKRGRKAG